MVYHVVEYEPEDRTQKKEIFVIPDAWFFTDPARGDCCYWPTSGHSGMVAKGKDPDPSWPIYRVTLKRSAPNLGKARSLEQRYSERTDVSESDEVGSGKRKRKERSTWSPVSADPGRQTASGRTAQVRPDSDSSEEDAPFPTPQRLPPLATPSRDFSTPSTSTPFTYPQPPPVPLQKEKTAAAALAERSLQRLFTAIEELKEGVLSNSRKLDRLLVLAQEDGKAGAVGERPKGEYPEGYTFPLNDPQDLERLNDQLSQEEPTRLKMVRQLGTIGGRDAKDCLRRVLAALLSTTLARQYNFLGMKGKKSLSSLRAVLKTIHEGVRKQHPHSTEANMRDIIASWLAGSRDRDHGKKERELAKRARELAPNQE